MNVDGNYSVYMHITPSAKIYIGITQQDINKRWKNGYGYKNSYFGNAVKKYGWDNISHHVIISGVNKEFAMEMEKYFINLYQTTDKNIGYNQTTGGEIPQITEDVKKKISDGNKKFWKEHPEVVKRIAEKRKGIQFSEEHKRKLSEAKKGKKQPKEMIAKRVAKLTGEGNPFYGKRLPEQTIKNAIEKNRKEVISIDEYGNKTTYYSISEAAKHFGIRPQSISIAIKKKSKSKGYYWQYAINDK